MRQEIEHLRQSKPDRDEIYCQADNDTLLAVKANSADVVHSRSEFQSEFDLILERKAETALVYSKANVDALLATKADTEALLCTRDELAASVESKDSAARISIQEFSELCEQTLKSELSSVHGKLAITEECYSRLQAQNKEISVSLREAKSNTMSEEERIEAFIEHQQTRSARLASLPCARVQLTAPLNKSVSHSGGDPDALRFAVAQAAASCGVQADDVNVHVSEETLQCDVCLKAKDVSVRKVMGEIVADLDKRDKGEIVKVLLRFGALTDQGLVKVRPKWPLERVQAEIELEYGYEISLQNFEDLLAAISTSFEAYSDAWNKARSKSEKAVDSLLRKESMARFTDPEAKSQFGDALLTPSEGKERSLAEHWVKQEASQLADVMQDAAKAQLQLKALMAPGTKWSQEVLNDPKIVKYSDTKRILNTRPDASMPCAEFSDPGVKGEGRVLEKAMTRKKPLDAEPPVGDLVDVSRLGLVFESAEHLKKSMDWMLENLDVVWLANKFSSPSCLGYRDVNMGVRQRVPTNGNNSRVHVTEVQLLLKDLYDIKMGEGHEAYETIRSVLAQCGVKFKDIDKIQKHILRAMDYTDGDVAREAADTLKYAVEKTVSSNSSLAQELIQQIEKDVTTAGIDEEEVQKLKAAAAQAGEENKRLEAEAKLERDAELERQIARLQALEDDVRQTQFQRLIFTQQSENFLQQLQSLQTGLAGCESFQKQGSSQIAADLQQVQQELSQTFHSETANLREELTSLRADIDEFHADVYKKGQIPAHCIIGSLANNLSIKDSKRPPSGPSWLANSKRLLDTARCRSAGRGNRVIAFA
jgi:hypothetical protein